MNAGQGRYQLNEREERLILKLMAAKLVYRLKSPATSFFQLQRLFCSSSSVHGKINTKVNFSLPDSDADDDYVRQNNKPKLAPPYDPFNKKPAIEEPGDPKNLQQIFHNMRAQGLTNNAIKMFDALSKDGLTHEALQLFAQIKDNSHMPDVIAHTAVIEAYANASQPKQALAVFRRMLASGVAPNAYTYSVLIRGLAADAKTMSDATKYLLEMMRKGMTPNASTYTAVFEAFIRENRADEGAQVLQQMKTMGFSLVGNKRSHAHRALFNLLFDDN